MNKSESPGGSDLLLSLLTVAATVANCHYCMEMVAGIVRRKEHGGSAMPRIKEQLPSSARS